MVIGNVVCIGLDLAWSSRNLTGGAVLIDGMLREARGDLKSDADIIQWVGEWLEHCESAVIAVDAPLCVPNDVGGRACERELGAHWRRFDAGPYYANRKNLAVDGVVRGEALVAAFTEHFGVMEAAPLIPRRGGRFVCEVFPHPAHVSLFGLKRILKYKVKRRGQYESYWNEYVRYQGFLAALVHEDPPLMGAEPILSLPAQGLRGKKLKDLEDKLDAITCAYIASYLWRHGAAGTWVYGTVAEGHILVPRFPADTT